MKTQQQRRKNGIMLFQVVVIRGSQSNIKSWIYIIMACSLRSPRKNIFPVLFKNYFKTIIIMINLFCCCC